MENFVDATVDHASSKKIYSLYGCDGTYQGSFELHTWRRSRDDQIVYSLKNVSDASASSCRLNKTRVGATAAVKRGVTCLLTSGKYSPFKIDLESGHGVLHVHAMVSRYPIGCISKITDVIRNR